MAWLLDYLLYFYIKMQLIYLTPGLLCDYAFDDG